MPKVFIIGSSGFIGSSLLRKLKLPGFELVSVGRSSETDMCLDLLHPVNFQYERISKDDYVIFAAAVSSPDICVNNYELARKINVDGTAFFINHVLQNHAKVLFLSSDAVYESDSRVVYDENASMAPKFSYGKMKAEIEVLFNKEPNFKSIRLSYVYSATDKYTQYLLNCLRGGKVAEVFHPYYRNVISLTEAIAAVEWLISNWNILPSSVVNLAGEELVSRIEMADEFKNYFGDKFEYKIVIPDSSFYDARPKVTRVKSLYLYERGMLSRNCFAIKYWNELKGIIDND